MFTLPTGAGVFRVCGMRLVIAGALLLVGCGDADSSFGRAVSVGVERDGQAGATGAGGAPIVVAGTGGAISTGGSAPDAGAVGSGGTDTDSGAVGVAGSGGVMASGGASSGGATSTGGVTSTGGSAAVDAGPSCSTYRADGARCLLVPAANCPGFYDVPVPPGTCVVGRGRIERQNAECSLSGVTGAACLSACATRDDLVLRIAPEPGGALALYLYNGTDACGPGEHGSDGFCRPCGTDDVLCEDGRSAKTCWNGSGADEVFNPALPLPSVQKRPIPP